MKIDWTDLSKPRIYFFVHGHPKAQGSKRHVGRGVMVEMSKDLAPWRQAIAEKAADEADGLKLTGPLALRVCFWFKRPASHYGTGRNAGFVKPSSPEWREAQPDLDKCCRAVCDALTISGVIRDDRHIVYMEALKVYGDPGVQVEVRELE